MDDYLRQQINDIDRKIAATRTLLTDTQLKDSAQSEITDLERQNEESAESATTPRAKKTDDAKSEEAMEG